MSINQCFIIDIQQKPIPLLCLRLQVPVFCGIQQLHRLANHDRHGSAIQHTPRDGGTRRHGSWRSTNGTRASLEPRSTWRAAHGSVNGATDASTCWAWRTSGQSEWAYDGNDAWRWTSRRSIWTDSKCSCSVPLESPTAQWPYVPRTANAARHA